MRIERVELKGLFGKRDINLEFNSKVRIIVGENGLGKTTTLNILNEIFRGTPENIIDFPVESVEITLSSQNNRQEFYFRKEQMKEYMEEMKYILDDFDEQGAIMLIDKILDEEIDKIGVSTNHSDLSSRIAKILSDNPTIHSSLNAYNREPEYFFSRLIITFPELFLFKKAIRKAEYEVCYLPTYRRIEADIHRIVGDRPITLTNAHQTGIIGRMSVRPYELLSKVFSKDVRMKFGMKDVEDNIKSILERISDEAVKGYNEVSSKMVAHFLDTERNGKNKEKFDRNQLRVVFERVRNSMPESQQSQLKNIVDNDDIEINENLAYYLSALLDVYKRTQALDSKLLSFCKVVNQFLYDKRFVYDENHIKFKLLFNDDEINSARSFPLDKLSSGEKQLVSLFALAYLSGKQNMVFIIDEPELSLSLTWQKILLPLLEKAPATSQIIAATHSPFIFDNELRKDTIGGVEYASESNK